MSVGKRLSVDEPLTEHDIADRLDKAASRVLRIMWDARQLGLARQIKDSRYLLGGTLETLAAELELWHVEPRPFAAQLAALSADAQAVEDAYSAWREYLNPTTGAHVSPEDDSTASTEQQVEQTASTTAQPAHADPDVHARGPVPHEQHPAASDAPRSQAEDNASDGDGQE